jgi:hypothetical protein
MSFVDGAAIFGSGDGEPSHPDTLTSRNELERAGATQKAANPT